MISQLQAEGAQRAQYYAQVEASAAAGDKFIASLKTQVATMNLTRAELLAYKADQLGVAEAAAPLIAALTASGAAAATAGESAAAASARFQAIAAAGVEWAAANSTVTGSIEGLAAANGVAEKSVANLTATIEAQNVWFKETTAEVNASSAASKGAAAAAEARAAAVDKVTTSLERQLVAATASKSQLVEYDALVLGATEQETAYAVELAKEVEVRAAQAAQGAKMAAALEAETAATNGARGATAAFTSEILVLFRELARGNLTQFAGSLTRLISLGGATALLFNPLTLSALALGAAFVKVENENAALDRALALTNGYVGETADSMNKMADAISQSGVTIGVARDALTELAATGRVTGANIQLLGTASAEAATYLGVSTKQMAADFTKLGDEPVKAAVKLNEQYHFLTQATFDAAEAQHKQGNETEAARILQEALASSFIKAADDMKTKQGPLLKFWQDLKETISGTVEAIGSIGATAGPAEILARDQANKAAQTARGPFSSWTSEDDARLQKEAMAAVAAIAVARNKSAADTVEQQRETATLTYDTWHKNYWTKQQKEAQDLKDYEDKIAGPLGLSAAQRAADEAQIRAKDRPKGAGAVNTAEAQAAQQSLKDQFTEEQKLTADNQKILDADHKAKLVSDTDFYTQERTLVAQDLSQKLDYYSKLEALLKSESESSKTSNSQKIRDAKQVASLESDARVAQADAAAKTKVINDAELKATDDKTNAVAKYQAVLDAQYIAAQKTAEAPLTTFGLGSRQAALASADAAAQAKAAEEITKLQAAAQAAALANPQSVTDASKKAYADQVAAAQAQGDRLVAMNHKVYDEVTAQQQDWLGGAKTAWANWADSANNTASQAGSTVTTALNGMTDSLTTFATTGKLSFTSLADSIIKDMIRIAIQAAATQALSALFGAVGGGASSAIGSITGGLSTATAAPIASALPGDSITNFLNLTGNVVGKADGGYISGPGSGTSDSINAKLSNGEFVVNAAATAANRPMLEAMNGGAQSSSSKTHFATGGFVGSSPSTVSGGTSIVFNISQGGTSQGAAPAGGATGDKQKTAAMQKELESAVLAVVQKHSEPGGQINKIIKQVSR
jgi:lambda family phage tail tape measure protein